MIEIKKVLFSDHPSYFKILFLLFFGFCFFLTFIVFPQVLSICSSFIKMFNAVHVWLKVQSFSHADKIRLKKVQCK